MGAMGEAIAVDAAKYVVFWPDTVDLDVAALLSLRSTAKRRVALLSTLNARPGTESANSRK